jgi:hypothetical protein
MQPAGRRDIWLAAAACLLLAATFEVPSVLRSHFGVPSAPGRHYRPGVPYEAFSYTKQTVGPAAPEDDPYAEIAKQLNEEKPAKNIIQSQKFAMTALNGPRIEPAKPALASPSATPAPKQTANLVRLTGSRSRNN